MAAVMWSSVAVAFAILCFLAPVRSHDENKRLLLDNEQNVDLGGQVAQLQAQIDAMQKSFENATAAMKQENEQQKLINEQLKQTISQGSGSVYVRWGRKACPAKATLVYTGFTAGKFYYEEGSGTDNLCLPVDPTWSKYVDGGSGANRAYIYGTEIDTDDSDHIFNYNVYNQDLPCAVCRSTNPSTVMIPARNNCYAGWTIEYNGYLMANLHTHHGSYNHICVDENPEFLQHGSTNDNQHILYLVEGKCGSLPCPPYVDGRELACVVCSK